jgi:PBP1b-binding outer membrane lipoprotein LpoB
MGLVRVLLLLIFAIFLAGCAGTFPLLPAQEKTSTTTEFPSTPAENTTTAIAEPVQPSTAEETPEVEKPMPPASQPAAASKTSQKSTRSATTPKVGSREWKKERAEDERKEQHIKEVIEGICRGC